MMRVDTANAAEVMFRDTGVPLIHSQMVSAGNDLESGQGHGHHRGRFARTQRAIAANQLLEPVRQRDFEPDCAAVTTALPSILHAIPLVDNLVENNSSSVSYKQMLGLLITLSAKYNKQNS